MLVHADRSVAAHEAGAGVHSGCGGDSIKRAPPEARGSRRGALVPRLWGQPLGREEGGSQREEGAR